MSGTFIAAAIVLGVVVMVVLAVMVAVRPDDGRPHHHRDRDVQI